MKEQDRVVIGGSVGLHKKIDGSVNLHNAIDGSGGAVVRSGGTVLHDRLQHRDYPDQHPMSAITGLQELFDDTWVLYCGTSEEVVDATV